MLKVKNDKMLPKNVALTVTINVYWWRKFDWFFLLLFPIHLRQESCFAERLNVDNMHSYWNLWLAVLPDKNLACSKSQRKKTARCTHEGRQSVLWLNGKQSGHVSLTASPRQESTTASTSRHMFPPPNPPSNSPRQQHPPEQLQL